MSVIWYDGLSTLEALNAPLPRDAEVPGSGGRWQVTAASGNTNIRTMGVEEIGAIKFLRGYFSPNAGSSWSREILSEIIPPEALSEAFWVSAIVPGGEDTLSSPVPSSSPWYPGFIVTAAQNFSVGENAPGANTAICMHLGISDPHTLRVYTNNTPHPAIDIGDAWRTDPADRNTVQIGVFESGVVEFWVNGQLVDSQSNPTTIGRMFAGGIRIGLRRAASSAAATLATQGEAFIGQFLVTTTRPEPYQIVALRPTADGPSDFTPDTGDDGYSRINESVPDGDESYVEADQDGDSALYSYRDHNGDMLTLDDTQEILSVTHITQARTTEPDNRGLRTRVGAAAGNTLTPVNGEYALRRDEMPLSPASGLAWEPAELNGQLGFQIDDDED